MAKLEGVKVIDMVGGEVTKIAYDGEEYAKVDGVGKAGDIGLRNCNDVSWARIGEYFEMKRVGNWLRYYDNHGDTPAVNQSQWAFYRKTSAQPTLIDRVETLESKVAALEEGGKQSQVISGDPQVGDKIRIVAAELTAGHYENGDILTVRKVGSGDYPTAIRPEEFDHCIYRKEFEIISRPEKAEEPALKVGDYVKVISEGEFGGVNVGEIGKIVTGFGGPNEYRVDNLTESDHDYFTADKIVKATDEEVAEAKRKLAEEKEAKKWAEIGRNPKEFKKGDIVHDGSGDAVFTVISDYDIRRGMVDFGRRSVDISKIELITPVERRFDR